MVISKQINCPLYRVGEQLVVGNRALHLPAGKPACLILARDVTELLCQAEANNQALGLKETLSCSGCQGIIKFKRIQASTDHDHHLPPEEIGFSGHLDTLPPEELMQALNLNQKTGLLLITFANTQAAISFNKGKVTSAIHADRQGGEAFYSTIGRRDGYFQFTQNHPQPELLELPEIGDFMNLLMEGLQRVDER